MEIVRNVYGYEFERPSYGFEVLPARLRSRIYPINFPRVQRAGASRTRVSTGQITDTERRGPAQRGGIRQATDHEASGGIPRLVNVICHNAILVTYGKGAARITRRFARAAERTHAGGAAPGTSRDACRRCAGVWWG
ncbi:MAG: hypothetical protein GWN84_01415 [Gammaproteobacteria bacterium]|nr:hypothetical protein [Gammaproteobacteria bacterium]NIR81819.1 hypothetical protein [Gammaproteobacteria bacterium]NIR88651.1 hypothetical protein [Gammaproteobacteria bacterium]NIU02927.1 hypothetical protein [Gammaproteobacteria bacterium]NIV50448.1 hypothetical protein [Gammaproteobacteria bacterium]